MIKDFHQTSSELLKFLGDHDEVSLQSFANETLRKVLLLSSASWFETRISQAMLRFAALHSQSHPGLINVVKRKAVDRQYHTLFDWRARKAGTFYSLLGDECGNVLKKSVREDDELKEAESAFLELGNLRNELIHENFAAYTFDKTVEEVYSLHERAEFFVVFLESKLAEPEFGRCVDEHLD